jgi:mRNA-degrading endonuclease RelE of RelBE toxin-antitoxin system
MNVRFERSFAKDLKAVQDRALQQRVKAMIEQIEHCEHLHELNQVKSIEGERDYYRIRIGDYRLGLFLDGDTVILVRFLHRKEIYRYFP